MAKGTEGHKVRPVGGSLDLVEADFLDRMATKAIAGRGLGVEPAIAVFAANFVVFPFAPDEEIGGESLIGTTLSWNGLHCIPRLDVP
jgi:hypothetical protein